MKGFKPLNEEGIEEEKKDEEPFAVHEPSGSEHSQKEQEDPTMQFMKAPAKRGY